MFISSLCRIPSQLQDEYLAERWLENQEKSSHPASIKSHTLSHIRVLYHPDKQYASQVTATMLGKSSVRWVCGGILGGPSSLTDLELLQEPARKCYSQDQCLTCSESYQPQPHHFGVDSSVSMALLVQGRAWPPCTYSTSLVCLIMVNI